MGGLFSISAQNCSVIVVPLEDDEVARQAQRAAQVKGSSLWKEERTGEISADSCIGVCDG